MTLHVQPGLRLDRFMEAVINLMHNDNIGVDEAVACIIAAVLSQSTNETDLLVVLAPVANDEVSLQIFTAIFQNTGKRITSVFLPSYLEASPAETLLRMALPVIQNRNKTILELEPSESQAERIFAILKDVSLKSITIRFNRKTYGVALSIKKFLQNSSSLQWFNLCFGSPEALTSEPEALPALDSVADGIGDSSSLRVLSTCHTPVGTHSNSFAASIARALAKSRSLRAFIVESPKGEEFLTKVRKALIRKKVTQNFDLCFSEFRTDNTVGLDFERNNQWTPLLSKNIPVGLWPYILARANKWTKYTSHSPADALFYLIKEKNDVLLHNVRRPRIQIPLSLWPEILANIPAWSKKTNLGTAATIYLLLHKNTDVLFQNVRRR